MPGPKALAFLTCRLVVPVWRLSVTDTLYLPVKVMELELNIFR